jgi:beta-phosphoglucomutase family hydrolase
MKRADGTEFDPAGFRAWLFDLDGVLTQTAKVHAAAWKTTFDRFLDGEGLTPPFDPISDYLDYVDGRPREEGVRQFLASRNIEIPEGSPGDPLDARTVAGLAESKDARFKEALVRDGVEVFDGNITVVRQLRARGVATAVVSASKNTRAVLASAGIADLFDVCIDGLEVEKRHLAGKPAPDSYLEAAMLLNVAPGAAVMVEDALVGVEAGRAGGFGLVVGIDHGNRRAELLAHGADVVVTNLVELMDWTVG